MNRYVLAPEAAHDLVQIWRYIKKNASIEMADRVESVIREKIVYLAERRGGGHCNKRPPIQEGQVLMVRSLDPHGE
jgi:plasmid stabilization system protein ParE